MIKEAIIKLTNKENLSYEEAKAVMNEIMSGEASDVQKSAYLTALTMKGETIDEITGSAEEMRNHAVQLSHEGDVLEIVGTGGDKSDSFNISTTSSLVSLPQVFRLQSTETVQPAVNQVQRMCWKALVSISRFHPGRVQSCCRTLVSAFCLHRVIIQQ